MFSIATINNKKAFTINIRSEFVKNIFVKNDTVKIKCKNINIGKTTKRWILSPNTISSVFVKDCIVWYLSLLLITHSIVRYNDKTVIPKVFIIVSSLS
tara:strand:+ start:334 stop:627 length:294 start_codon:yes stop_codon:yes gene_type:complete